jgi:hypothetical protein
MKITVIVQRSGTLVGTARHTDERSDVQAALRPIAGNSLHEIEVPDDYKSLTPDELHDRIRTTYLTKVCG